MKKVLEITNLKKYYHTTTEEIEAIKNISFSLYEGEFISIVGPSGCGKSTILSVLSNLIDKSDGSIDIKDNLSISYMLQSDSLLPFLTILDNALLGLKIKKKLNKENKEYVVNLLNTYGLGDFINKYPSSLSGGMRQRVALIRTLAVKPDILLLDEATSALDSINKEKIQDLLLDIQKKRNNTLILVTHSIEEAVFLGQKIIVMKDGKIDSIINNDYFGDKNIRKKYEYLDICNEVRSKLYD